MTSRRISQPTTPGYDETPFSLTDRYLSANPGIAEALEIFDVSLAAYERALRGLGPTAHRVTAGSTTLAAAVDLADLG